MVTLLCDRAIKSIHSSVVIFNTKVHLVYVLLFVAFGHNEACMPNGGLAYSQNFWE